MILNLWTFIREDFDNLFTSTPYKGIFVLITGVMLGILLTAVVYAVLLVRGARKKQKKIQLNFDENKIQRELVLETIKSTQNEYDEMSSELTLNGRLEELKTIAPELIEDIAKIYYPDSKYPFAELSVEETIELCKDIIERVDKLFNTKILKNFKTMHISKVVYVLDKKKAIEKKKVTKGVKILKLEPVRKTIMSVINAVNPIFWARKGITKVSLEIGIDQIMNMIIEIIGEETAKVYSKNLFAVSQDDENKISELETLIENAETEEEDNGEQ